MILLDNVVAIIFLENYQFILSETWQVFAVATLFRQTILIISSSSYVRVLV